MESKRARLDRFLSSELKIKRKDIRLMLAQNRVRVDGIVAKDIQQLVDEFSHVSVDDAVLKNNRPSYVMLNKPVGVVSATKDDKHKTVIDLLDHPAKSELHIVGRLDLNTSGLMLLTNDGRWSRKLMSPESKVEKRYRVTLQNPLSTEYIDAFAKGFYFEFEDITTQAAKLEIISEHIAEVTLTEGKYHQIKRMFGRFRNPVIGLHRYSVGELLLDPDLDEGGSRELSVEEVNDIFG
ncbi:pseudouridine synthase [Shewanella violacea]|uniref:Pseudouridine synthase n=1 Tax=Shewanella violacea (strain JCM 10179 / CIP 106290 / LMG 19151 / DSS12) TaxID=637905 RepID=D4ZGJ4_SHEVD|nr:pseudouridine synthase [Shewanella violacea]BAJ00793.1 ribosomal small subunit pseudouridine synthase A [Shewanella violacea DSS12]